MAVINSVNTRRVGYQALAQAVVYEAARDKDIEFCYSKDFEFWTHAAMNGAVPITEARRAWIIKYDKGPLSVNCKGY